MDRDPGRCTEADFGHIHVDFPDGRRLVQVLIVTRALSYRTFAIALPTERTEAILLGLVVGREGYPILVSGLNSSTGSGPLLRI